MRRAARLRLAIEILPYGVWRTVDGREVMFDRKYRPMWQRQAGGRATPADPAEWVQRIAEQQWLWEDRTPARARAAAITAVVSDWVVA